MFPVSQRSQCSEEYRQINAHLQCRVLGWFMIVPNQYHLGGFLKKIYILGTLLQASRLRAMFQHALGGKRESSFPGGNGSLKEMGIIKEKLAWGCCRGQAGSGAVVLGGWNKMGETSVAIWGGQRVCLLKRQQAFIMVTSQCTTWSGAGGWTRWRQIRLMKQGRAHNRTSGVQMILRSSDYFTSSGQKRNLLRVTVTLFPALGPRCRWLFTFADVQSTGGKSYLGGEGEKLHLLKMFMHF